MVSCKDKRISRVRVRVRARLGLKVSSGLGLGVKAGIMGTCQEIPWNLWDVSCIGRCPLFRSKKACLGHSKVSLIQRCP